MTFRRQVFRSMIPILALTALGIRAPLASTRAAPPYRAAPSGVTIQRDISYLAPDRKEKLDMYAQAQRPPGTLSPGIVIIHGGGWTSGSKSAEREFEVGITLAKAGYVCVSVEYRLDAHDRWPTNIYDCKNAVRFLRANAATYGIDPDHIGVIGGSAGGHLALMLGVTDEVAALEPTGLDTPYPGISDRVQAVVDMYGITNLPTAKNTDPQGNPTTLKINGWNDVFGDHRPITDADRLMASPAAHLSSHTPPTLILHGTIDTTVDRDQSIDLDKAMTTAGITHQFVRVQGAGHTFDLERWRGKKLSQDLRPVVVGFFDKYLKPSK